MNEPIKGRISREVLQEWLNGDAALLQAVKSGRSESCYTFFKVPQQENVDYIFGQENYYTPHVGWRDKFEFCGIYSRQNQLFRLADHPLKDIVDGLTPEECMDTEDLLRQVNAQINAQVERIIANDRGNLPVQTLTSGSLKKGLLDYREGSARTDAIQRFIAGSGSNIQFQSWYGTDHWTESAIASYLDNPAKFVQGQAEDYIEKSGEELLLQFLQNDALVEEIRKIEADADNPVHRMRAITEALDQCGAKSVNVTVQIADTELSFKASTTSLKGYRTSYSTWDIPAADRRLFYDVFGRSAQYDATDIIKITSGRKTIYEAPPAQTETLVEIIGMGGIS